MNNKTCGDCKYFVTSEYLDVCVVNCETRREGSSCDLCDEFKPKVVTNGDRIIAGGTRAIAEFAGNPCEYCRYYKDFCELPDGKMCEDAIEEYLNAPAESEGGNDADR